MPTPSSALKEFLFVVDDVSVSPVISDSLTETLELLASPITTFVFVVSPTQLE